MGTAEHYWHSLVSNELPNHRLQRISNSSHARNWPFQSMQRVLYYKLELSWRDLGILIDEMLDWIFEPFPFNILRSRELAASGYPAP